MMLSTSILIFYVLVQLIGHCSAISFQQYLDKYQLQKYWDQGNFLRGSGIPLTVPGVKQEILAYFAAKPEYSSVNIEFYSLLQARNVCRLYGYLRACSHPFPEFGGVGSDVETPYQIDFMVTNEYLESSPFKRADVKHFPLFVAGVVPVINIPGVAQLILTRETVARIFRGCTNEVGCLPGSITMWNDTAIKATNSPSIHPILDSLGPIQVIVRKDNAGGTLVFKTALSKFESAFKQQVGADTSKVWNGTTRSVYVTTVEGIIEYVKYNPGSMNYDPANLAMDTGIGTVKITDGSGTTVQANSIGLSRAFNYFGLNYGNDGRNPKEHTIDITNPKDLTAWPISNVAYLVLPTNNTGSYCVSKYQQLLRFFEYFYSSASETGVDEDGVFSTAFARLPQRYGLQVLDLLRDSLYCDGKLVYEKPVPKARVTAYTDETFLNAMYIFSKTYEESNPNVIVTVKEITLGQVFDNSIFQNHTKNGGVLLVTANKLALDGTVHIPFAGVASVFIFNFCSPEFTTCYANDYPLYLDIETAALILQGEITYWNDSRIAILNPENPLPQQPIALFSGPVNSRILNDFRNSAEKIVPEFDYTDVDVAFRNTYVEVFQSVSVIPYSFSLVPLNGTTTARVRVASLISNGIVGIKPSSETIENCAYDTYNATIDIFELSSSIRNSCYPLSTTLGITLLKEYSQVTDPYELNSLTATAKFAQFLVEQNSIHNIVRQKISVLTQTDFGTLGDLNFKTKEGHVVDLTTVSRTKLDSLKVNNEHVLIVLQDMQWIPFYLTLIFYAVMALEILLYGVFSTWVLLNRQRRLIRNSSPAFLLVTLFGASLISGTIIPLSLQDDFRFPRAVPVEQNNPNQVVLNAACLSEPILFSFGFFISFSPLLLKTWRLVRIFDNRKLIRIFVKDSQLFSYLIVIIVLVVILNAIWALISPLVWERFPLTIADDGLVMRSSGYCFSPLGIYPALPLIIAILVTLIVGNYFAYVARKIPTEFNESKWTAMAMAVTLESIVMGVPVLIIVASDPIATYVVKSCICLLISGSLILLLFMPKVFIAYGIAQDKDDSNPWRFVKGPGSDGKKEKRIGEEGGKLEKVGSFLVDSSSKYKDESSNPSKWSGLTPYQGKRIGQPQQLSKGDVRISHNLRSILDNDPARRRFRRYLQSMKMDEGMRFFDALLVHNETEPERRAISARAIISTFIVDNGPLQINLSSKVKNELVEAIKDNNLEVLSNPLLFQAASDEMFKDLQQSDAFRGFVQNDTFSQIRLIASEENPANTTH